MYQFESRVRYSEVDEKGEMTWIALMDYFQDSSIFHSEELHLSVDYLKENHMAWVLSSWQICLVRKPRLAEKITIQTWPYGMKGFYGMRNFCMVDEERNRLAYANSVWVLMDTKAGRPMRVPQDMTDQYGLEPPLEMATSGRKIEIPGQYEEKEGFVVPSYFIDTNHHMNNGRYVQVALSYLPEDTKPTEVCVEYKKAAVQGDWMIPRVTMNETERIVTLCGTDESVYAVVVFKNELSE